MKTYMPHGNIERKWYVVDAEGKTFGRLASQVAAILMGKNKPTYTPSLYTAATRVTAAACGKSLIRS